MILMNDNYPVWSQSKIKLMFYPSVKIYHLYLNLAMHVVGQGAGETAARDRGYFMGKKLYKH